MQQDLPAPPPDLVLSLRTRTSGLQQSRPLSMRPWSEVNWHDDWEDIDHSDELSVQQPKPSLQRKSGIFAHVATKTMDKMRSLSFSDRRRSSSQSHIDATSLRRQNAVKQRSLSSDIKMQTAIDEAHPFRSAFKRNSDPLSLSAPVPVFLKDDPSAQILSACKKIEPESHKKSLSSANIVHSRHKVKDHNLSRKEPLSPKAAKRQWRVDSFNAGPEGDTARAALRKERAAKRRRSSISSLEPGLFPPPARTWLDAYLDPEKTAPVSIKLHDLPSSDVAAQQRSMLESSARRATSSGTVIGDDTSSGEDSNDSVDPTTLSFTFDDSTASGTADHSPRTPSPRTAVHDVRQHLSTATAPLEEFSSTTRLRQPSIPPMALKFKNFIELSIETWCSPVTDVKSSRPPRPWASSKRWTCCRCRGRTIVEQKVCAKTICGHHRCGEGGTHAGESGKGCHMMVNERM